MLYNCSRKILKVCSRSVLEQSKVNSRTVLEQIIRTFLEKFWNHSTDVLELFRDIYRTLNQGSKISLVRSYLRVPQAVGQVNILIFLVKIILISMYAKIFRHAGQVPILRYFEACKWDIFRGVLQLFQKNSKGLF